MVVIETVDSFALAESPEVALVEDDEVAFSVELCREVHRIYGGYLNHEVEATDVLLTAFRMCARELTSLRISITDGTPARRLDVALAEAAEMLVALSGGWDPREMGVAGIGSCARLTYVRRFKDWYAALPVGARAAVVVLEMALVTLLILVPVFAVALEPILLVPGVALLVGGSFRVGCCATCRMAAP